MRVIQGPLPPFLLLAGLAACGDGASPADAEGDPGPYAIQVTITLTDDGQGVGVPAQNGATAHVPAADLVGKTVWWATSPGGVSITSTLPIEFGGATVADNLIATFSTAARYEPGAWELSTFISVAGGDPLDGPQPGDLAAFDNTPPPEGQPPVTGSSLRVTVISQDVALALDNEYFVQF